MATVPRPSDLISIHMPLESAREVLNSTEFVSWENEDFVSGVEALTQAIKQPVTPALVTDVAFVELTSNGLDVGLVVNGELIITADPGTGDDGGVIEDTGTSFAALFNLSMRRLEIDGHDEWQWGEIIGRLVERGDLPPAPVSNSTD